MLSILLDYLKLFESSEYFALINSWIYFFPIAIPLLTSLSMNLVRGLSERQIMKLSWASTLLFVVSSSLAIAFAALEGERVVSVPIFTWGESRFSLRLDLDLYAGVFLALTSFLSLLVVRFSRRYMHREPGSQRFFASLSAFMSGLALLALAEDLGSFFIGWEILGISSFILVGFYRHRQQPIRNSQRVYAVYRICDVGILIAAYLMHHHLGGVGFHSLSHPDVVSRIASLDSGIVFWISAMLLLASMGKSGQFPFSYWVPRAMEGPTPSSAIFYGALSIHAGIFLLLRTYPIWSSSLLSTVLVGIVGGVTALLGSGISRVQTNIKGQIAYASVAQVGWMFIEIALGYPHLALVHFLSNAIFRCYQLLVSPSVVSYLLMRQSSLAGANQLRFKDQSFENRLPSVLRNSLYNLLVSEAYVPHWIERFDLRVNRMIFGTFSPSPLVVWSLSSILGVSVAFVATEGESAHLQRVFPFVVGVLCWYLVGAISFILYEAGRLKVEWAETLAFISLLGLTGFPISPLFFGEDLVLQSAMSNHPVYVLFFVLVFVLNGVALIRAYCKEFLLGRTLPI